MQRNWSLATAFVCVLVPCLGGCGSNLAIPLPPQASPLAGNWLLVGSLPVFTEGPVNTSSFNLAMTFNVSGDQISATSSYQVLCQSSGYGGAGGTSVGDLLQNGSFTLTENVPLPVSNSLVVQGTEPTAIGSDWAGSYTWTNSGSQSCNPAPLGNFTATRIQDVTGTYVGSGTLDTSSTGNSIPVTIQAVLQQGATNPVSGVFDNRLISGTIAVQGTSCFSSGATSSSSAVDGGLVQLNFVMNDGSKSFIPAYIGDTAAHSLVVEPPLGAFSSGACAPMTLSIKELDKQ